MRTARDPFWRAVLAGVGAVSVVPLAALLITLDDGGRPSTAESEVPARTVHVKSGVDRRDLVTLRSARAIARSRLGAVARTMRRCRARPQTEAWRTCVRWPLARLGIDGRVAGGMLYGVAAGDGLGACRAQALGEANTLRVLGDQANTVVRGLVGNSPEMRAETVRAYRATRSLVEDLRRQFRRPACARAVSRGR